MLHTLLLFATLSSVLPLTFEDLMSSHHDLLMLGIDQDCLKSDPSLLTTPGIVPGMSNTLPRKYQPKDACYPSVALLMQADDVTTYTTLQRGLKDKQCRCFSLIFLPKNERMPLMREQKNQHEALKLQQEAYLREINRQMKMKQASRNVNGATSQKKYSHKNK